jgi:hypothetical protein
LTTVSSYNFHPLPPLFILKCTCRKRSKILKSAKCKYYLIHICNTLKTLRFIWRTLLRKYTLHYLQCLIVFASTQAACYGWSIVLRIKVELLRFVYVYYCGTFVIYVLRSPISYSKLHVYTGAGHLKQLHSKILYK